MTWEQKRFTAYKPVYGITTRPPLLPSANTLSDMVTVLHYVYTVCVCFLCCTPVPAHATVLTADPHHNASQHMLTAISTYPFRGLWGVNHRDTGTINRSHYTPTGNLESSINITCMSLDCGRKPEHLKKPLARRRFEQGRANHCSIGPYSVIE